MADDRWTIYVCPTCGWWFGDGDHRDDGFRVSCDEGLDGDGHPEIEMQRVEVVAALRRSDRP